MNSINKPRHIARMAREFPPRVGHGAFLEVVKHPNFFGNQMIWTSPVVSVDSCGHYVLEIETANSIYEIVD